MDKRSVRRSCFAAIKSLSAEEKTRRSAEIAATIESKTAFREAKVIFSYLALASEPNLEALVERHPEKIWAFSRVREDGSRLSFHEVRSGKGLRMGDFGFLEPDPDLCPERTKPDLVLVPGVGFDPNNRARLGRGKGHYDRFLGPLKAAPESPTVFGICFSIQQVPLEPESHDVAMDGLITDAGVSSGF
ncbi:MAG: 5-formyltetrahydrofolate cyclo-ligase [Verrucomicrobiales bacterium]|nr:5-formyltetrahydrofolate cyclo-ligase [Verrucomicrobiales bacterium]